MVRNYVIHAIIGVAEPFLFKFMITESGIDDMSFPNSSFPDEGKKWSLMMIAQVSMFYFSRLGATVGPLTGVLQAVLNSPRGRTARLDRTLNGTRHRDLRALPTHDRLSRHTRYVILLSFITIIIYY